MLPSSAVSELRAVTKDYSKVRSHRGCVALRHRAACCVIFAYRNAAQRTASGVNEPLDFDSKLFGRVMHAPFKC